MAKRKERKVYEQFFIEHPAGGSERDKENCHQHTDWCFVDVGCIFCTPYDYTREGTV